MACWSDLIGDFTATLNSAGPVAADQWLKKKIDEAIEKIAALRGTPQAPRNVIFYGSAWLQKAAPAPYVIVHPEDINGFMSAMNGMTWDRGLTLILHTPGGLGAAAQTIMAYLHTKFEYIEAIIPAYAMSAGTMMALGSDHIVMGRQSQLGPIDGQLAINSGSVSAAAVVEQFERAKEDIVGPKGSVANAHLWAPILQSMGPSLLHEAQMALAFGATMVSEWLAKRMCKKEADPKAAASQIAEHFNAAKIHKSHARRIDRDEVKSQGLSVEHLEDKDDFQDAVLTLYHLVTIGFQVSPTTKMILSSVPGHSWVKNYQVINQPTRLPIGQTSATINPPPST